MAKQLIPDDVTVCLTSCGRLDLLTQTLEHFFACFTPQRFLLIEDSGDAALIAAVRTRWPQIETILNEQRLGQFASIDKMYAQVTTPYVLHLEDDWAAGEAVDLAPLKALLQARQDISGICLRVFDEVHEKFRKTAEPFDFSGISFAKMPPSAHPEWFGYSFNPSFVRLDIFQKYGPFAPYGTEANFSLRIKQAGATIAYQTPGIFRHIGKGQHVDDPFQPRRPKFFWQKWLYSLQKRRQAIKG